MICNSYLGTPAEANKTSLDNSLRDKVLLNTVNLGLDLKRNILVNTPVLL
jgi:hypothetical protein